MITGSGSQQIRREILVGGGEILVKGIGGIIHLEGVLRAYEGILTPFGNSKMALQYFFAFLSLWNLSFQVPVLDWEE